MYIWNNHALLLSNLRRFKGNILTRLTIRARFRLFVFNLTESTHARSLWCRALSVRIILIGIIFFIMIASINHRQEPSEFLPSLAFSVIRPSALESTVGSLACGKLDGLPIREATHVGYTPRSLSRFSLEWSSSFECVDGNSAKSILVWNERPKPPEGSRYLSSHFLPDAPESLLFFVAYASLSPEIMLCKNLEQKFPE